jgi:hypothetical protein
MGILVAPLLVALLACAIPAHRAMARLVSPPVHKSRLFITVVVVSALLSLIAVSYSYADHSGEQVWEFSLFFEVCCSGGVLAILGLAALLLFKASQKRSLGIAACLLLFSAAFIPVSWFLLSPFLDSLFRIHWLH